MSALTSSGGAGWLCSVVVVSRAVVVVGAAVVVVAGAPVVEVGLPLVEVQAATTTTNVTKAATRGRTDPCLSLGIDRLLFLVSQPMPKVRRLGPIAIGATPPNLG